MKETRIIMGMPVTVEIVGDDTKTATEDLAAVFDYFTYIDEKFSTYKPDSEMMRINRGEIAEGDWSDDMAIIFGLAEDTKQRTNGFFDIRRPSHFKNTHGVGGKNNASDKNIPFYDPSGIVKGWAIFQATKILEDRGRKNFYVDAGGDIQTKGTNNGDASEAIKPWTVGIKNPLKQNEIVKTIYAPAKGVGIATSGTYIRGDHIYNPHDPNGKDAASMQDILSLTIIGPNIYEADRFATAAFAMGKTGINFIESLPKNSQLEGYIIDKDGIATMTNGFEKYTKELKIQN